MSRRRPPWSAPRHQPIVQQRGCTEADPCAADSPSDFRRASSDTNHENESEAEADQHHAGRAIPLTPVVVVLRTIWETCGRFKCGRVSFRRRDDAPFNHGEPFTMLQFPHLAAIV